MVDTNRFDILLVSFDPSQGHKIRKTRPCVIVSPNEMNKYIKTLIVAPMTSKIRNYPTRIPVVFESKEGTIALDQIRTIDKSRIIRNLGTLDTKIANTVLETLGKMFS